MKQADLITYHLMRELRRRGQAFVLAKYYINNWECDLYSITKSGISCEYEIKVDRKDFLKDFEKKQTVNRFMQPNKFIHKHDEIKKGERTNRFYFVVPEGLITKDEVPEYAGLIEASKSNGIYKVLLFRNVKDAPLLHKCKIEISRNAPGMKLAEDIYWKYLNLFWDRHKKMVNNESLIVEKEVE